MSIILSVATIIAIILGPTLAIRVQKIIERITQRRDEKRRLFMTLMATRDQRMLQEHVQALNMINVIFAGKGDKDKAVIEAWSEYRDHLYSYPREPSGKQPSDAERLALKGKQEAWASSGTELIANLLEKMASSLNYHFGKVFLKKGAYTPSGYGEDWAQQQAIRRGLIEVLYGKPLPIRIIEVPSTEGTEPSQKVPPEKPSTKEKPSSQEGPPEEPEQEHA